MSGSTASPPIEVASVVPRACNACRARKIGCDRKIPGPCGNCSRSKIECVYNEIRPREKRARILLSHQYEQKIDHLDNRLDEILDLLRELKTQQTSTSRTIPDVQLRPPSPNNSTSGTTVTKAQAPAALSVPATPSAATASPASSSAATHVNSIHTQPNPTPPMVEGNSSLTAQTAFADEFLQKAVHDRDSQPEMRERLDALRVIVEAMKRQPAADEMRYPHAAPAKSLPLEDCKLPPIQSVVQVLRMAKSFEVMCLAWVCELMPLKEFQDSVFSAFMRDDSDLVTIISINVGLHFLFWACGQVDRDHKKEFLEHAQQCGKNVETALAHLPLHLPANDETISALLSGAFYAVELSKPSLAWILASKAAELCLTLGYHRDDGYVLFNSGGDKISSDRHRRHFLFWSVYIVDKNLSLRLGRSSSIQDYDISVSYPSTDDPGSFGITSFFLLWVLSARIQGQVYEMLYCSEAVSQPESVKRARVKTLVGRLEEVEAKTAEVIKQWSPYCREHAGNDLTDFFLVSDHVLRLSLLTLVLRSVPNPPGSTTTFSKECIDVARKTLERHQECMRLVEVTNCGLFSTYMHWTILMAPFVPFIVLFCQVIETKDKDDLARLQAFVTSLQYESSVTESVERFRRLFQVLVGVAAVHVSSGQDGQGAGLWREGPDQIHTSSQAAIEVDAYLGTLGFSNLGPADQWEQNIASQGQGNAQEGGDLPEVRAANPVMWLGNEMQLEDWFYNNEQMVALESLYNYPT
ncbi:putative transcriptional regulatory protein [Triangularia verruculosa]|uniref:Transcriptional regulatory protein n=1 Tax=Triangularia verruculosa TaxID=2587418 RepID=A0AAN7ARF6_9PEZI|nr:putative transcriptional regulatory protein [Triangularia verruculosa]